MHLSSVIRPSFLMSFSLVLALSACAPSSTDPSVGGVDDVTSAGGPGAANLRQSEFGHIHGIGVNPGDGNVYVATHQGLFRFGESSPQRVGEDRSDIMGFMVAGPNVFLASGHPSPGTDAPSNLGLLRSIDAGVSWEAVSLYGDSDFHDLSGVGTRLYGLDSSDGTIKRSDDAGAGWTTGPVLNARDLDVDPDDPDRVLATTETGLLVSTDAGEKFAPFPVQPPELLVLIDHIPGMLGEGQAGVVGLDVTGAVWELEGSRWTRTGTSAGQPEAFAAVGRDAYLAAIDGAVRRTDDGGHTWVPV